MTRGLKYTDWDCRGTVRTAHAGAVRLLLVSGLFFTALLGVLLAPSASSLVSAHNGSEAQATVPSPIVLDPKESVNVLVPRQPIYKGDKLISVMFKWVRVPLNSPAAEGIRRADQISGHYAARDFSPNIPIFERDVRNTPELNEVVKSIPTDYRAISVSVDATSGVEGWASPGAAVDVVLIANQDGVATSNILAQNAEVLSSNRRSASTARPGGVIPTSITLLARAEEAARIGLGSKVGKIVLHLRGWKDARMGKTEELTLTDLKAAHTTPLSNPALNANAVGRPRL